MVSDSSALSRRGSCGPPGRRAGRMQFRLSVEAACRRTLSVSGIGRPAWPCRFRVFRGSTRSSICPRILATNPGTFAAAIRPAGEHYRRIVIALHSPRHRPADRRSERRLPGLLRRRLRPAALRRAGERVRTAGLRRQAPDRRADDCAADRLGSSSAHVPAAGNWSRRCSSCSSGCRRSFPARVDHLSGVDSVREARPDRVRAEAHGRRAAARDSLGAARGLAAGQMESGFDGGDNPGERIRETGLDAPRCRRRVRRHLLHLRVLRCVAQSGGARYSAAPILDRS